MQKLGFGTAAIGRPQYINIKQTRVEEVELSAFQQKGWKVLDEAYQHGIRYFDTAPGYGLAEQLLIDWIQEKNDSSIEIATKWGYTYVANFDPKATVHEVKDHGLSQLNRQWEKSKQLLPFLTTLQIHSATLETGILKNKAVLERLAKIKSAHNMLIGLTTTGDNQLEVIKEAMDVCIGGIPLFAVYQVTYNILDQSLSEISDELLTRGIRIVIKEAMANGRLFRNGNYLQYGTTYDVLEEMAKKYKVGIDAIALRFCIDSIHPFKVLSGASQAKQVQENLKANSFTLDDKDIMVLKSLIIDTIDYWSERKKLKWN